MFPVSFIASSFGGGKLHCRDRHVILEYMLTFFRDFTFPRSYGVLEMASDFNNKLGSCESASHGKQTSSFDCDALKGMSGSRSDHCTKEKEEHIHSQLSSSQYHRASNQRLVNLCLRKCFLQEEESSTRSFRNSEAPHLDQEPIMKRLAFSREPMQRWILLISSILGLISLGSFSYTTTITSKTGPVVPALFIFGDSLADPGNNNHLISFAKANHPPYGRQFDTHMATGRFTNGRTALDFLAAELGLPLVPPFMDPATKGSKLLQGVNFASAGSGILNSTGMFFGEIITMWKQLEHFRDQTQPELYKLLGETDGKEFFRKSIYYIISGSNDFLNGYYFLIPTSPPGISLTDFMELLVSTTSRQVKALYELGARKIGVAGLAPLGCCPSQITKYNLTSGGCVGFLNEASTQYNTGLKKMLTELREELKDLHLVYSNLYDPLLEAINYPAKHGFNFTHAACCGVGKLNGKFICTPFSRPCDDPQDHIFFDYYHPTDTMYNLIFMSVYFNGPPFSEPYSGQYLANLEI